MGNDKPQDKSLIQPDQMPLFRPDQLPDGWELLQIEERKGRSTGERIARDQERYQGIVQMIAEGVSLRRTARAWGVAVKTVQAIRDRETSSGAIATVKKGIANNLRAFAESASERLLEEADDIPVNQLAIPLGITIDKMQLLDGEATSRSEVVRKEVVIEDFDRFLAELPRVDPIDSGAEDRDRKEAALPEAVSDPEPRVTDNKSGDVGSQSASIQEVQDDAT